MKVCATNYPKSNPPYMPKFLAQKFSHETRGIVITHHKNCLSSEFELISCLFFLTKYLGKVGAVISDKDSQKLYVQYPGVDVVFSLPSNYLTKVNKTLFDVIFCFSSKTIRQ